MLTSKKIVLRFDSSVVEQPIIYHLVKEYNLVVNILKADINPHKEGYLILELSGETKDYQEGLEYIKERGVRIESLSTTVVRKEDKCLHCGICTSFCPVQALELLTPSMEVVFHESKCIVCASCVEICPVRAMELHF